MSGSGILPNSALAAANSNNNIRLYFQAGNGYLRESGYYSSTGSWTTKQDHLPTPVIPKTSTPIACAHSGLSKIHVFYLDINHVVSDVVYNGSNWVAGELNKKEVTAASYSQLAAIYWDDQIRVYYQKEDDNGIYELMRSGTDVWADGQGTKQQAAPGSRLAAIRPSDGVIRVYYQAPDDEQNVTRQVTSAALWAGVQNITPPVLSPPQTAYAAISFGNARIRLYYQKEDWKLYEATQSGSSSAWSTGSELGVFIPQSFFAAVTWGNISAIRVYGMTNETTVQELMWRTASGWSSGSTVPTA